MIGGFSFCGIDIADIGLEYAPENSHTYVYGPGSSNIHEESFDGHDGGYFYGTTKTPKELVLRCFYEEKHIAHGVMAKFHALFKVGKSGMLIFKRRPWCYYYATVTNVNTDDMKNYLNGLVVITMKAYYPFARGLEVNGHLFYNLRTDPYHDEIMLNTGLFDDDTLVPLTEFSDITFSTNPYPILLYNPGTERAKVGIIISGHSGDNGIIIHNSTTNQETKFVAFNVDGTNYIATDSISGKTIVKTDYGKELAFLYHDKGFIELEPSFPIVRDLYVTYNNNSVSAVNILYEEEEEREWYIGKYIYLNGWKKIVNVTDNHTIQVTGNTGTGSRKTSVVLMNELYVTGSQGSYLSRLDFIYKPTYA